MDLCEISLGRPAPLSKFVSSWDDQNASCKSVVIQRETMIMLLSRCGFGWVVNASDFVIL